MPRFGATALPLLLAAAVGIAGACAGRAPLLPEGPADTASPRAPDSFLVAFETTKGPFTVMSRREWAPLGVDRFYDLVQRGFYDGVTFHRVLDGYVAQFGITDSLEVNQAWRSRGLPDEPVVERNTRGRVAFARGGPRSRTAELFIDLSDNSPFLDTIRVGGVPGYPPIGEVSEGMENVAAFESRWADGPSIMEDSIAARGRSYLDRVFPGLDRILRATVVESWP